MFIFTAQSHNELFPCSIRLQSDQIMQRILLASVSSSFQAILIQLLLVTVA